MARVAMVVGNEFEDSEFRVPYDALRSAGHEVTVLGTSAGEMLEGKSGNEHVKVEETAGDHDASEFDALVLPGGHGPDHIRTNEGVIRFIKSFAGTDKPIAAVCHGPQLLIEAGMVEGKRMTSWPSVRTDLQNAGAHWVDQQVVEDGDLITSRKPDDLEVFSRTLVDRL